MTVQAFTTAQVASQLAVSESTARRLYDEYIEPEARLPRGRKGERHLAAKDVEIIREVLRLKGDNPRLTSEEIKAQLKNIVFPAPIVEASVAAQEGRGEALAPIAMVVEAMRGVTAPMEARQDAYESRLQALEQRIEPVEAQRLRVDVAWLIVAAFIAGLIVGLAVWWFQ